jgi:hypothetical protein
MILTTASEGERMTEELSISPSLREKISNGSTIESARTLTGMVAVNVLLGENSTIPETLS